MVATGVGLLTTIIATPIAIGLQAGAIASGLLGAGGRSIYRKLEAKARKHDQIRVQAVSKLNSIADKISAEVRESNQQLLILINRARVIGYHDRLPHAFDPQGLAEAPVRIKLAPEFTARIHGVFEPTQQPSN